MTPWSRIRRTPSARPGTTRPHLAVTRDGSPISLLDLMGRTFVLLAGSGGETWRAAASAAGEQLGVAVDAYRVGDDLVDDLGRFEALYGTGTAGAALIRPDGFVAWRAAAPSPDPERC